MHMYNETGRAKVSKSKPRKEATATRKDNNTYKTTTGSDKIELILIQTFVLHSFLSARFFQSIDRVWFD